MKSELGVAALTYASRGWAVFPLHGKKPATHHGFHDATSDPATIRTWWTRWPNANIGAPIPDTLAVVDVDLKAGGFDTLEQLPQLPETLTTRTGGGGAHLWFLHPGGPLRQGAGILGPGIDTRVPGRGYVVLPPSVHKSGAAYEWVEPDQPAVMLPDWVASRLRPPTPAPRRHFKADNVTGRLAALCKAVAEADEGRRNDILFWAACRAAEFADTATAGPVLAEAARSTGLDDREIAATLRSGFRKVSA